jgi:hypothetical protein
LNQKYNNFDSTCQLFFKFYFFKFV